MMTQAHDLDHHVGADIARTDDNRLDLGHGLQVFP